MQNNYEFSQEYLKIINPIITNETFIKLNNIKHHNTTRLNHSLKVSYYSYKIAKFLKLDYVDVARAGLLHDFYFGNIDKCKKIKDKVLLFSTKHPNQAVANSLKYFNLTEKEENIIKTHMFPVDYKIPKYAESWIVSLTDKVVSTREFSLKFMYKLSYLANLYLLIFLGNFK